MNWYLVLDQIMDDNIGICPAVNHKSSMLSRVVIYLVFPFVFSMCHVSFKLACHIVILVTLYKFFFSFLFFCLFLSLSLSFFFLISLLLKKTTAIMETITLTPTITWLKGSQWTTWMWFLRLLTSFLWSAVMSQFVHWKSKLSWNIHYKTIYYFYLFICFLFCWFFFFSLGLINFNSHF